MFFKFRKKSMSDEINELNKRNDEYSPDTNLETNHALSNENFLMNIEDVFTITVRGTVAVGKIESGVINIGDTVEIVSERGITETKVTGIEAFRKIIETAKTGDNVGILLKNISAKQIHRGYILKK